MDEETMLGELRAFVETCDSKSQAAEMMDVSLPFLCDVLQGRRRVSDKIARYFGRRKVQRFLLEHEVAQGD